MLKNYLCTGRLIGILAHHNDWLCFCNEFKGYIQAGVAFKGLRRFKDALENFLHSYFVKANQPQHAQRGDQFTPTVDLLVEIITTIIQLPRHRGIINTCKLINVLVTNEREREERLAVEGAPFCSIYFFFLFQSVLHNIFTIINTISS